MYMNYKDKSDFEVNCKLNVLVGNMPSDWFLLKTDCGDIPCHKIDGDTVFCEYKHFIDSWADIGPLIEEHEVTIEFDASESGSHRWCNVSSIQGGPPIDYSKNPKRAAAICIIMKLEAEHDKP